MCEPCSLGALARLRARWDHPPLDPHDVEERIAIRFAALTSRPTTAVVSGLHACRLFVRAGDGWVSRYVHAMGEVDGMLDFLLGRAAEVSRRPARATAQSLDASPRGSQDASLGAGGSA